MGQVPFSERLLNLAAQERIQQVEELEALELALPGNDTMIVRFRAKIPTKVLGIKLPVQREILLDIEPQIELTPQLTLYLRIREGLSGLDRTMIGWFQNQLSRVFPGELRLGEDLVLVDIGKMLRNGGLEVFVDKIHRATLHGERGRLMLSFQLAVG